ncbi:MAG: cyanophycinase [Bacteroidota bacterium]
MPKGHLVLIGGGKDTDFIFERIFELAGEKANVKMAIIPTASGHINQTMNAYVEYFTKDLGLKPEQVWAVPLAVEDDDTSPDVDESQWKMNAFDPSFCEKIAGYNLIFFVGGDQRRYLEALEKDKVETPLLKAIYQVYENGGVVAGTSAGTNIMSEQSIAGGRSEEALSNQITFSSTEDDGKKLLIIDGFGFIKNVLTDTHFDVRGRLGRLIEAASLTGNRYGFGMGECTSVVYHPDSTVEVCGLSDVFIIDMVNAVNHGKKNSFPHITNVKVHILTHGDCFNLETEEFKPGPGKQNIINTPYYGKDDYNISLNVFGEYEIANIITKYLLDNEAHEVIGIMDFEKYYLPGNSTACIRFLQTKETNAFYCKAKLQPNDEEPKEIYSGIHVRADVIPLDYVESNTRHDVCDVVAFAVDNSLRLVVFDAEKTYPVCDAKVEIYDQKNELIFRTGTDKFGKARVSGFLEDGAQYMLKVIYDESEIQGKFNYEENMRGFCFTDNAGESNDRRDRD